MEAQCRLCREERRLSQSHVVPAFIWRTWFRHPERVLRAGYRQKSRHLRPSPAKLGLVQKEPREPLLCSDCEGFLNDHYEKPALRPWLQIAGFGEGAPLQEFRGASGGRPFWVFRGLDYKSLKLFLLSILWRAHASSLPEYMGVNLGPHGERIRQMLRGEGPGRQLEYPVMLFRLLEPPPFIPNPLSIRLEGHRACRLSFPGVVAWAIASSHPVPDVAKIAVSEEGVLLLPVVGWQELSEYQASAEVAKAVLRPKGGGE